MSASSRPTVVFVGICCVDVVLEVASYPTEDVECGVNRITRRRGGNAANSAVVAAILGEVDSVFVGSMTASAADPTSTYVKIRYNSTTCVLRWIPTAGGVGTIICVWVLYYSVAWQDFEQHGVTVPKATVVDNSVSMPVSHIIFNQQTGSRTILHYKDPSFPELCMKNFSTAWEHVSQPIAWVHFEGRNVRQYQKMMNEVAKQSS